MTTQEAKDAARNLLVELIFAHATIKAAARRTPLESHAVELDFTARQLFSQIEALRTFERLRS